MNNLLHNIDLTKVRTLIYHLPEGKAMAIRVKNVELFLQLDYERGRICDTSEIDGVVHFFPDGVA